jgi:uncharacterized protein
MKKILIITDGEAGDHFVKRVADTYTSDNIYYIVQTKKSEIEGTSPVRFKFYEFDPTSFYKLANLLKMEFVQVLIVMENCIDVENTIKNIKAVKKQLRIIVLDKWGVEQNGSNIVYIKQNEILASKLVDYLPNVPVIAQNVGIGEGEIMEVLVPFGSSFVYRHLGSIQQSGWRIVAMYRNRQLLMPSRRRMIQPNDLLLLVGDPLVLKSVYRAIKRELGQFPEPFGSSIYLYIDMVFEDKRYLYDMVRRALFIYRRFNKKLYIKVFNPTDLDFLEHIKEFSAPNIEIDIDYGPATSYEVFREDIKKYNVGLVVVSKKLFASRRHRELFYEMNIPVLKIANRSISKLKDAVLILSENKDLEKVSATVFDISSQLGFNLELINYINEQDENKDQVIEHFNNLATIFSKTIKINDMEENPILSLKRRQNFLHVLPFTKKMTLPNFASVFSIEIERLYHKLDDFHQIFIPSDL